VTAVYKSYKEIYNGAGTDIVLAVDVTDTDRNSCFEKSCFSTETLEIFAIFSCEKNLLNQKYPPFYISEVCYT
jgi:hypothetical protein